MSPYIYRIIWGTRAGTHIMVVPLLFISCQYMFIQSCLCSIILLNYHVSVGKRGAGGPRPPSPNHRGGGGRKSLPRPNNIIHTVSNPYLSCIGKSGAEGHRPPIKSAEAAPLNTCGLSFTLKMQYLPDSYYRLLLYIYNAGSFLLWEILNEISQRLLAVTTNACFSNGIPTHTPSPYPYVINL